MNIDMEILLGKSEREFKRNVNEMVNSIFSDTEEELLQENLLGIKYSKNAELLREYNYNTKITEMIKNKEIDIVNGNNLNTIIEHSANSCENLLCAMVELRTVIESAMMKIQKNDITSLKEGYTKLAEVYNLLEKPLYVYDKDNHGKEDILLNKNGSYNSIEEVEKDANENSLTRAVASRKEYVVKKNDKGRTVAVDIKTGKEHPTVYQPRPGEKYRSFFKKEKEPDLEPSYMKKQEGK